MWPTHLTRSQYLSFAFIPFLLWLMGCALFNPGGDDAVDLMTAEALSGRLDPASIAVIDVRSKYHWEKSDKKIPGAIRQPPSTEDVSWSDTYPRSGIMVLYCA